MRCCLAAPAALQLFACDRAPERVDDSRRVTPKVLERSLEMLGPEPQANVSGELATRAAAKPPRPQPAPAQAPELKKAWLKRISIERAPLSP